MTWTPATDGALEAVAEAHRLRAEGATVAEVAASLGVSRRQVFRYLSLPKPAACPCCGRLTLPDDA